MSKEKITLHNTPQFYVEYMKNWLTHEHKKPNANAAELAIVGDLAALVEIAASVMQPGPEAPGE